MTQTPFTAEEGGPELAENLEIEGYERFVKAAAAS